MKNSLSIFAALCMVSFLYSPVAAQEGTSFVVIAHPDVPTDTISKKKVSQLMLKEVSKWEDGLAAHPVDLDSQSTVRNAFSRQVHGRSVASIKNFWLRKIFSGSGEPPPEVADDNAVLSFVKSHPGGIGYVSLRANRRGVKVLDVAM